MDETPQPGLGTRLRMARTRLDLTQEQVAHAVGFVPTVYGRIERGDMLPSVPKLRELCVVLGVSADMLLALPPPPSGPDEQGQAEEELETQPALRRLAMLVRALPPPRFRLFRVALQTLLEPSEAEEPGES
ncbi:Transcriptional regulator, XRE family [Cystobacter fuscus DSM 2262]|uniref:Transcriptional regulator, XRE family n=1 Tax=Cystobacter fuscus (strain ATCC 25194 / DSM 2262 / NBRC 100088 / M29) TaxID=1242864 RepID=S9QSB8_CYSF2|nr:helix-turn-helix transcriptional regulator [Cystobacter fuscus]EPX59533.1 Transcriptional regulator, XRE family [Cystobacter fuscus DSM 2262]